MRFNIVLVQLDGFFCASVASRSRLLREIAFRHFGINRGVVGIDLESFFVFVDGLSRLPLIVQQAAFGEMVIRLGAGICLALSAAPLRPMPGPAAIRINIYS